MLHCRCGRDVAAGFECPARPTYGTRIGGNSSPMHRPSRRTPADEALEDEPSDDERTVWHGKGRDRYEYSIDRLPDGGFVVYRHRGVQHIGTFDTLTDAKREIGVR